MANLISRIDEKQNSLYYQYLQESAPKDINTVISGLESNDDEFDKEDDTFDLFSQIQSINGANSKTLEFESENEVEQIIEEQTKKEEELIRKKNEEIFNKEREEEIARKKEETLEALNESLEQGKKKPFSTILNTGKDKFLGFFKKKDEDNEIDELIAMKEKEEAAKKEKEAEEMEKKKETSQKEKKVEKKKEEKKEEPDWKFLALHDEITGLLNKKALEDYDASKLDKYAVIYLCINGLNHTNNTLGREKGDFLIKTIGKSLNTLYPNCVYRIYGGEFTLLFNGMSDETVLQQTLMSIDTQIRILSNKDMDMDVIYSVSTGELIGTGRPLSEVVLEARQMMLARRAEYEALHPEILGTKKPKEEKAEEKVPYDALLTKEQLALKTEIKDCHIPVTKDKFEKIIATIKENTYSIDCIFMTDADFNNLCIFNDVSVFIEMAEKNPPDFSYIYILFPNGPQYLGCDAYDSKVTHIFENLGKALTEGRIKSSEDLTTIKGINIFEHIIWDFD